MEMRSSRDSGGGSCSALTLIACNDDCNDPDMARQLLASETGLTVLHHMFRDQIAAAEGDCQSILETELRQAYAYFARKYPLPHVLG